MVVILQWYGEEQMSRRAYVDTVIHAARVEILIILSDGRISVLLWYTIQHLQNLSEVERHGTVNIGTASGVNECS